MSGLASTLESVASTSPVRFWEDSSFRKRDLELFGEIVLAL